MKSTVTIAAPLDGRTAKDDSPATISIRDRTGPLVTIKADGSIEYGAHYTPDLAAQTFWQALATSPLAILRTRPGTFKIVDTDNFGGDYPDEKLYAENIPDEESAQLMCNAINAKRRHYAGASRFWKVVPHNYILQPGFQP